MACSFVSYDRRAIPAGGMILGGNLRALPVFIIPWALLPHSIDALSPNRRGHRCEHLNIRVTIMQCTATQLHRFRARLLFIIILGLLAAPRRPLLGPVDAHAADGAEPVVDRHVQAGSHAEVADALGAVGAQRQRPGVAHEHVPGVLDADKKLLPSLTVAQARALIADGTISGGMIPKVETCIEAIERGVEGVVILNGKTPHAVLLELFTQHGAGTLILP